MEQPLQINLPRDVYNSVPVENLEFYRFVGNPAERDFTIRPHQDLFDPLLTNCIQDDSQHVSTAAKSLELLLGECEVIRSKLALAKEVTATPAAICLFITDISRDNYPLG